MSLKQQYKNANINVQLYESQTATHKITPD